MQISNTSVKNLHYASAVMLSLVMHCAFMDAGCLKTKALPYSEVLWTWLYLIV
jgi:hypothetical protein